MQECFLPHYNERRTPVDMLVLHATCHADADEVFESLDKLELSCHYFVDLNGRITRMVDEQKRAWHAGAGYWQGIDTDLNSHSIGIEIGNLSLGQQDFAEAQIEKLIPFCRKLIKKYNLDPRRIVAHSDIAPTRKPDPGIRFPWKRLAREGIGLWYQLRNAEKIGVDDPAELLKIIGYDGTFLSEIVTPSITTVWQNTEKIASSAADIIVKMIDDPSFSSYHLTLGVRLIERDSTRCG